MAANLREVVRNCLKPGRSPHVVGAGIGVRCRDGRPTMEPALTILVKGAVPKEELRSLVSSRVNRELAFEVLDVGEVVALGRPEPLL